jgi:rhodanese-related sulfurtransferase
VAQQLLDHGLKNVHPLYGGFDAWQKAGYPVEQKEARSTKEAGNR